MKHRRIRDTQHSKSLVIRLILCITIHIMIERHRCAFHIGVGALDVLKLDLLS